MAVIARDSIGTCKWMRCVSCKSPTILANGVAHPSALPLHVPLGVSGVELAAWREVRECLSVGATTAAVMLCRKLLLHIAVAEGLAAKDDRDRAPTFNQAVEHLEQQGVITSKMRPWVDRVREVGNEANHEIDPVHPEVAMDVARFTEQLLRLAYEMDALMAQE